MEEAADTTLEVAAVGGMDRKVGIEVEVNVMLVFTFDTTGIRGPPGQVSA